MSTYRPPFIRHK